MKIKRCQQRVSEVACEWWTYLISAPHKHINNSWRKLLFVKKKAPTSAIRMYFLNDTNITNKFTAIIFWRSRSGAGCFLKLLCESLTMIKDNTVQKQHVSNCEWQHSYLNYRTVFSCVTQEKKNNEMNNVNNDLIIASLWFCISVAWFIALSQVFMSSWVSALK